MYPLGVENQFNLYNQLKHIAMETINIILSRPKVQSITFSKKTVTIVTVDNMSHTYSMEYFMSNILPKLTKEQPK